jgi:subtilisin family serine protease
VGTAPEANLYAVRVLDDDGTGTLSDILCGVEYVLERGDIDVINLSLGYNNGLGGSCGPNCLSCLDAVHIGICQLVNAGTTVVVAAGNSAADAANTSPANFEEVITVSAIADFDGLTGGLGSSAGSCRPQETDDTTATFTNYGEDIDIAAPGVCINSLIEANVYALLSGTSMASPHVAGAAAILLSHEPALTPAQVKERLITTGAFDYIDNTPATIQPPLLNVTGILL